MLTTKPSTEAIAYRDECTCASQSAYSEMLHHKQPCLDNRDMIMPIGLKHGDAIGASRFPSQDHIEIDAVQP